MVYTVYGLEMAQTVLLSKTMFNTFVYNFFHPDALDQIFDLWVSVPIIGGIGIPSASFIDICSEILTVH